MGHRKARNNYAHTHIGAYTYPIVISHHGRSQSLRSSQEVSHHFLEVTKMSYVDAVIESWAIWTV